MRALRSCRSTLRSREWLSMVGIRRPGDNQILGHARCLAVPSAEVKHQEGRMRTYQKEMKQIRKEYIAKVQKERAVEEGRQKAERMSINIAKRQRLLMKAEVKRQTALRVETERREHRERYQRYLQAMQEVRDEYNRRQAAKQDNLLTALLEESSRWITHDNMDKKITEELFEEAGRTTFQPTGRSKDWHYMGIPYVLDFTDIDEEDLFDEKEDKHFLTQTSPFPDPALEELRGKTGRTQIGPDSEGPKIGDAVWRRSRLNELFNYEHEAFRPDEIPEEALGRVQQMAEEYERVLYEQGLRQGALGEEVAEQASRFDPSEFELDLNDPDRDDGIEVGGPGKSSKREKVKFDGITQEGLQESGAKRGKA